MAALQYHYPPRPGNAIAPTQLSLYEQEGWVLEAKMDGMCGVFSISRDGTYEAMTRHGPDMPVKRWKASTDHIKALHGILPTDGIYVLVAEIMMGRVTAAHLKHVPLYVHDILVADGKSLVGKTFAERKEMLTKLIPEKEGSTDTHHIHSEFLWRAKTYTSGFAEVHSSLQKKRVWFPEYEGVVLKRPKARLAPTTKASANEAWQLKSRFPTATISF